MDTNYITNEKLVGSYSEGLAFSLIHFSRFNLDFASWFSQSILETLTTPTHQHSPNERTALKTIFTLHDEQQATHRALWLLYMLEQKYLQQNMFTTNLLISWANGFQKEEPRAIILGLKYGIEPFGLWGEPSRKSHPMNILIHEQIAEKQTKGVFMKDITSLSHTIVTKGLMQAKGNTRHLEPELGDWLFGEKRLNLYKAHRHDLVALLALLEQWNAPHTQRRDTMGDLTHIAIGPSVYLEDTGFSEALSKVT